MQHVHCTFNEALIALVTGPSVHTEAVTPVDQCLITSMSFILNDSYS